MWHLWSNLFIRLTKLYLLTVFIGIMSFVKKCPIFVRNNTSKDLMDGHLLVWFAANVSWLDAFSIFAIANTSLFELYRSLWFCFWLLWRVVVFPLVVATRGFSSSLNSIPSATMVLLFATPPCIYSRTTRAVRLHLIGPRYSHPASKWMTQVPLNLQFISVQAVFCNTPIMHFNIVEKFFLKFLYCVALAPLLQPSAS